LIENVETMDEKINYQTRLKNIEELLMSERGFLFEVPYNENVMTLMSGGLDSSLIPDLVIKEWDVNVYPVFFKRGQKAEEHEETAFDFFVKFYKEKYSSKVADPIKIEVGIPPKEIRSYVSRERLNMLGHRMRNSTMINYAIMYAGALNDEYNLDIRTILVGSVADDVNSPESGLLTLRTQNYNVCEQTREWDWQITSSYIEPTVRTRPMDKADLILYARDNKIPLEKTRSCFSEYEIADGTCFACVKRLKAFEFLGIKDPIKYKEATQNG
jgi:7-cyano-7-deazaguanine synthase in queuosine biosynthesis